LSRLLIEFNTYDNEKAKFSSSESNSFILLSIIRPASNDTFSGWKVDNPLAISSALTNSLQSKITGNMVKDTVVFPATDSVKTKLDLFTSWWKDNFDSIKEEIILHKEEYNQQIIALFSRSLID